MQYLGKSQIAREYELTTADSMVNQDVGIVYVPVTSGARPTVAEIEVETRVEQNFDAYVTQRRLAS